MIKNLVIGLFFLAIFMLFLFLNMKSEKDNVNNLTAFKRNYLSVNVAQRDTINYSGLLSDIRFIDGRIYGKPDMQSITCIDENGTEIRRWGNSTGLSRYAFIVAWQKHKDGLTIMDGRLGKLFTVDNNDSLIYERSLPYKVIRAAWMKDKTFIVKSPDPDDKDRECFYKLDTETFTSTRLDYPMPDYPHADFTLDGYFDNSGRYYFHICYMTGYFFCFDKNGQFLYSSQTVDKTGPPVVLTTKKGGKRFHPLSVNVNNSSYTDDTLLYILSDRAATNDNGVADVIDCYLLTDGLYKGSIAVPRYKGQSVIYISRADDGFLAKYNDYIVEYVYEKTSQ